MLRRSSAAPPSGTPAATPQPVPTLTSPHAGPAAMQVTKYSGASEPVNLDNIARAATRYCADPLVLEAEYASADGRYRQTILEQFPSIRVGFSKARDADGIYSRGFQTSVILPIFNRNRGVIAVAKAAREGLHDAYAARRARAPQTMSAPASSCVRPR